MAQSAKRRDFIKQGVGLGFCGGSLLRAAPSNSPNERIQHAAIGVNGKGWSDLKQVADQQGVEIAAICDIDTSRMARAAAAYPNARRYQDWRELLAQESERIDSVCVSTPDHMHASIAMSAMNLGKHVFCQKPLTTTIKDARTLKAAAKKAGVATQMGIQMTASREYRAATIMLQDGVIGKIKEVYAWSNKPASNYRPTGPRPDGADPVPATVDWDGWLGVARERPYKTGVYHPRWWRGWQDFGVGWLGDMGCHIIDTPFRALELSAPLSVRAEVEPGWRDTPARRNETWPTQQIVEYLFAGTEYTAGEVIKVTWSDGGKYPPDALRKHIDGNKFPAQGSLFIGESGAMLLPHPGGGRLYPEARLGSYKRPKLAWLDHYGTWIDACRGKAPATADFQYAASLTEVILLGTVALRCPDTDLKWDASKMTVTNHAEANQYLSRPTRPGWEVSGLT